MKRVCFGCHKDLGLIAHYCVDFAQVVGTIHLCSDCFESAWEGSEMKAACDICGREKNEKALVAEGDGLLLCARCAREYKDQIKDEEYPVNPFEDAS